VRPGVGGWDVHYQRIEGSNPGLREATKRCVALGHRWGHVVDDLDGLNPPVGPVFEWDEYHLKQRSKRLHPAAV